MARAVSSMLVLNKNNQAKDRASLYSETFLLNLHVRSMVWHKIERSQIFMELESTKREKFYCFLLLYCIR